jgi:carbamoyltransferase
MITLGINAAFHDSAAAIVVDGEVIAAAEEERFTRIKHAKRPLPFSAWELPYNAIDFCLQQAGAQLADVDHVAYSLDPQRFLDGREEGDALRLPLRPSANLDPRWDNPWDPLFAAYVLNAPRFLADGAPHHLKARFAGVRHDGPFVFHFIDHHLAHQASAFLAAPFERCAVMTLDGRGEQATTSYGVHADGRYRPLGEVTMPHSLGLLYERITTHLGFLHSSDEYKVMALAALGEPRFADVLHRHVRVVGDGRYTVAPMDFAALFCAPRQRGATLEQVHLDLAASLQQVLEDSALALACWLREASGERCLALAGGVALNCLMNARLRDAGFFDEVWVQPAAGDAGTALGAALWVDACLRGSPPRRTRLPARPDGPVTLAPRLWQMRHAYLGPQQDDAEVEALLKWAKQRYHRPADVVQHTAGQLAAGRVVAWHQGRMEFGPRALGARSILASPVDAGMQARINELKDREDFRPVAPALPEEDLGDWFAPAPANGGRSPFMLFTYDTLPAQATRIPAACHADLSARVQTVSRDTNPRFHALLQAFERESGVPVLINTSFNVRGEPMVNDARDALNAFHATPIDVLVIGDCVLEKQG